jgi:hypothetical protein
LSYLMQVPLEGGGSIVVEVGEDLGGGPVRAGAGDIVGQASQTLEAALDHQLKPVAEALIGRLRHLATVPNEATVELGLKLSMRAGMVIANTAGEASLKVTLKWTGDPRPALVAEPAAPAKDT